MSREEVIEMLIPLLFQWRIGSKKQCRELAEVILGELKLRGVYVD